MTNDTTGLPSGTSASLVADYLIDLLRSMSALAEAADLHHSKTAIERALAAVVDEREGGRSRPARSAG